MAEQNTVATTGNIVVAEAFRQCAPDVIAAYPITPQTTIVEELAKFAAQGRLHAEYVTVESEHSAMSACVGASAAGARVITATGSQGLALMWEELYIASGLRLPIVLANANRALAAPINIHCDHSDIMGARDTGWIMLFAETAQDAYDNTIIALKVAEDPEVLLPAMTCLDGFITTHSIERTDMLDDGVVKEFVGDYKPQNALLDTDNQVTHGAFSGLGGPFFELKKEQRLAMDRSAAVVDRVGAEYSKISGRPFGKLETHTGTKVQTRQSQYLAVMWKTWRRDARMDERIVDLLGHDPVPWLLDAKEPYTRWVARTQLLPTDDVRASADKAEADRAATLTDTDVISLIDDLTGWGDADYPGHHSPAFLPNRLNLLADMGIGPDDAEQVESLLDELLAHHDKNGRFESFGYSPGRPRPEWGSLLCDTNAITDVLLRFDRGDDARVQAALKRMVADSSDTSQGSGWRCVPEKRSLFRGPGRANDACPQVTLEGLRAFSHLAKDSQPPGLLDIARTSLEIWRRRSEERPYAFGHGYQFKSVKWPNFWYDTLWLLETLTRYPALWRGAETHEEDREALAELAACLIAYNLDDDGRCTPRRVYREFDHFSFGRKLEPSPFATARILVPLVRMADLADRIALVDVEALPSSKGGSGVPVPPKRAPRVCPMPSHTPSYPPARAIPRVLARHHIGTPHVPASVESIVADIVGLHSTYPSTPYLALHARLPGFVSAKLDTALYERRSLARVRCIRGSVFIVRHDMILPVIAATRRPVIRHAREFARQRGVDPDTYARLAPRVLSLLAEKPLTTAQVRTGLDDPTDVDIAALVSLMAAESLVLRNRPIGSWQDRQWTYLPFEQALPDVKLDSMDEAGGDISLLRAYVRAFGPATHRDAGWWSGMGTRRVDRALETLGDEIIQIRLEAAEESYLMHAADVDELSSATMIEQPQIALLPLMDPLVMGYAHKDRFVPDSLRPFVFDRSGNATSIILVDGIATGVWDLRSDTDATMLLHLPDSEVSDKTRMAIAEAAKDLGRLITGDDVQAENVAKMTPLANRVAGSFTHPLR
jgi:pyruvate/2-oxoacid:ferredoxin oxidoreductase alpha subunit